MAQGTDYVNGSGYTALMKVAVFSDMHGNADALAAVLSDIAKETIDSTVCLGDAVQGGAQPAETVAMLRNLGAPVVMGNADSWLLTGQESGAEPVLDQQEQVRQWSLSRISAADIEYMQGFQPTVSVPLDGDKSLLCFHGSPKSFDDLIFPETPESEIEALFGADPAALLTGGHTHLQQMRRYRNSIFSIPAAWVWPTLESKRRRRSGLIHGPSMP